MPVSSPSYFPPNRSNGTIVGITAGNNTTGARNFLAGLNAGKGSTSNDLIVIGDSAFVAGDTQSNGTIVLGTGAAAAMLPAASTNGSVVIGYKAINTAITVDDVICIGANCLTGLTEDAAHAFKQSIIIGGNVLQNYTGVNDIQIAQSVILGGEILKGATYQGTNSSLVMIGQGICTVNAANAQVTTGVIIGSSAGGQGSNQDVIIGQLAGTATGTGNNNVLIGNACFSTKVGTSVSDLVLIGANCDTNASTDIDAVGIGSQTKTSNRSVVIGYSNNVTNVRNIVLGAQANAFVTHIDDAFIVGTFDGSTARSMFWGSMATGNLLIGNTNAVTTAQEFGGVGATNVVKLLSGTKGASNTTGGGYLYVDGANDADMPVHWVDATGQDTSLSPSGPKFYATGLGVISPAQLAATVNDYAPAGFAQAQMLRITPAGGGSTLNGIAGGAAGREVTFTNLSTVDSLTVANQAAGSAAANRIATPGAVNLVINAQNSVMFWYDGTSAFWRVKSIA